jgi:putative spermidine/putrescine transport system substrate-binding protein
MPAPNSQALIARTFYLKPTNAKTVLVDGSKFPDLVVVAREYFTDNRAIWIERFEMEIAAR